MKNNKFTYLDHITYANFKTWEEMKEALKYLKHTKRTINRYGSSLFFGWFIDYN
jgi:hypothetical protein